MFTHVEVWHLATNMFALFIFGPMLEGILGRARFLAVYLVSGLVGSASVLLSRPATAQTLGASGALFGLLGALLLARKAGCNAQSLLQNLLIGVVITFVGSAPSPGRATSAVSSAARSGAAICLRPEVPPLARPVVGLRRRPARLAGR